MIDKTSFKQIIKGKADNAYRKYIRNMQQVECLGTEYKLKNKEFNLKNLAGHCNASIELGKHQAYMDTYNNIEIDALFVKNGDVLLDTLRDVIRVYQGEKQISPKDLGEYVTAQYEYFMNKAINECA